MATHWSEVQIIIVKKYIQQKILGLQRYFELFLKLIVIVIIIIISRVTRIFFNLLKNGRVHRNSSKDDADESKGKNGYLNLKKYNFIRTNKTLLKF